MRPSWPVCPPQRARASSRASARKPDTRPILPLRVRRRPRSLVRDPNPYRMPSRQPGPFGALLLPFSSRRALLRLPRFCHYRGTELETMKGARHGAVRKDVRKKPAASAPARSGFWAIASLRTTTCARSAQASCRRFSATGARAPSSRSPSSLSIARPTGRRWRSSTSPARSAAT